MTRREQIALRLTCGMLVLVTLISLAWIVVTVPSPASAAPTPPAQVGTIVITDRLAAPVQLTLMEDLCATSQQAIWQMHLAIPPQIAMVRFWSDGQWAGWCSLSALSAAAIMAANEWSAHVTIWCDALGQSFIGGSQNVCTHA